MKYQIIIKTESMKLRIICFLIVIHVLSGCLDQKNKTDLESEKAHINKTESDFAAAVRSQGIKDAFLQFADDSAVLKREKEVIKGKQDIARWFDSLTYRDVTLSWAPDFTDVSLDGTLGYTYGRFEFNAVDTSGKPVSTTGIFHTVWKKQEDGSWKYVFD